MHDFCYYEPTILNFMKPILLLLVLILGASGLLMLPSCTKEMQAEEQGKNDKLLLLPPYNGDKGPRKQIWSVGIYRGTTPFKFNEFTDSLNPVLSYIHVDDVAAKFVADPFIYNHNGLYYMFFEVMNATNFRGEIGYATSTDGLKWEYGRVVLRERFHLSYPYVFEHEGQIYMVPETHLDSSVRLYKAVDFPTKWELDKVLLKGYDFVDPSIIYYNAHWWLFVSNAASNTLKLFYADELKGSWIEHPMSPVVAKSAHFARPGGRLMVHNGQLVRFAQDDAPYYGVQVWGFKITELTPQRYAEQLVTYEPVVKYGNFNWNRHGMHQVDVFMYADGYYYAVVDGYY